MIKTFTTNQQRIIEEKVEQLKKVRDGTLTAVELARMITERRLNWLGESSRLWDDSLSLENAYRLLIYYHMRVEDGILMNMNGNLLRVEARNFCPYLEASKILGLDTRFVCKEIGEPSLRAFFQQINSRFNFSRDYKKIRPYHECCLEFLELR